MKIIKADEQFIANIIDRVERGYLPFSEYRFLTDQQLKEYYLSKLKKLVTGSHSGVLAALSGNEIKGFLSYNRNDFDSEIFGFDCYRLSDIVIMESKTDNIHTIVNEIVNALEFRLKEDTRKFHLQLSLKNSIPFMDRIFNTFCSNSYYYLHTLITFCFYSTMTLPSKKTINSELIIRQVEEKDIDSVANLAKSSFKLSRFHFDPYLDDSKGDELIGQSAINSIKHGFVDIMFVAEIDNKVVGYYSGKKYYIDEFERMIGEGVIGAVDRNYRGKGIFSALDIYLLDWFSNHVEFTELGTYLGNFPVHKTFTNKSLPLVRSAHQFSKMIELS